MNRPLQAGDVCMVVQGMTRRKSPNLGLRVTITKRVYGNMGMDHSTMGPVYRCKGAGVKQMDDSGNFVELGWADFPGIWLYRVDPPEPALRKALKELEQ